MMGDYHVRFCERLRVKFPLPTRRWELGRGEPCPYNILLEIVGANPCVRPNVEI